VGPAEVETPANKHPSVAETAAIGMPDPIKGEVIVLYAVLKPNIEYDAKLKQEISEYIVRDLGKPFRPSKIYIVKDLPRTRSGKIMRRVVKAVAMGKEKLGDLSSLENPESIEYIRNPLL
jgi:acetyl-CoA synthetase